MHSEAVRQAALFPMADLHALPPGHPDTRVTIAGMPVWLPDGVPWAGVFPDGLNGACVDQALDEVRRFLRTEQRERAIWFVPQEPTRGDLADALLALGMKASDVAGIDPRGAAMAIVEPPPPGPAAVEARLVASFDEFLAAHLVAVAAFGMGETMRRGAEEAAERQWPFESADTGATFVALKDGDVVACARASFGNTAVHLTGGGTRPDARGQGAYTALVHARWNAAVERGTPVLTVDAGDMSRPILERLGFTIVGWCANLVDELAT